MFDMHNANVLVECNALLAHYTQCRIHAGIRRQNELL